MKDYLYLEKELEEFKIDLCLRPDFNFIDAFKLFDPKSKGFLNTKDLKLIFMKTLWITDASNQ
jgi:hypothetical protein